MLPEANMAALSFTERGCGNVLAEADPAPSSLLFLDLSQEAIEVRVPLHKLCALQNILCASYVLE